MKTKFDVSCAETYLLFTFGRIEALDEFQMCAIDSLYKDNLTVITGKAGSGKLYCL